MILKDSDRDLFCQGKRKIYNVVRPVVQFDDRPCFTWQSCKCSELHALRTRLLGAVPEPTSEGMRELRRSSHQIISAMRRTYRGHNSAPWSLERVMSKYAGSKREKYLNAFVTLQTLPVQHLDSQTKSFIKAEKVWATMKDPRLIQARDPRYNLKLLSFLRPIEEMFYNMKTIRSLQGVASRTRLIGKGLNQTQRMRLLEQKWRSFGKPVVVGIDASRFDQHVSKELLMLEHDMYRKILGGDTAELSRLLDWQLNTRGKSAHGIRYKVVGKRVTGDVNTALGNCLLMVVMVFAAMRMLGVSKFEIADDGDDVLLFLEEEELHKLDSLPSTFLEFGHEVKIECVAREFQDILWCQTRPTLREGGWTLARDYRKVLATGGSTHKYFHDWNHGMKVFNAIGRGELAINKGIPVLDAWARMMIRLSGGWEQVPFDLERLPGSSSLVYRLRMEGVLGLHDKIPRIEIDDDTRVAFERTWGLSVEEQKSHERALDNYGFDSSEIQFYPDLHVQRDDGYLSTGEWEPYWPLELDPAGWITSVYAGG